MSCELIFIVYWLWNCNCVFTNLFTFKYKILKYQSCNNLLKLENRFLIYVLGCISCLFRFILQYFAILYEYFKYLF